MLRRRLKKTVFWAGVAAFLSLSGFTSYPSVPSDNELRKDLEEMERRAAQYEAQVVELEEKLEGLRRAAPANLPSIVQGRLTPTAATPVTTAATTSNTTVRFSPYNGGYISLFYRLQWRLYQFTELSLVLAGTAAATNYDVFCYAAAGGIPTLILGTAWTNATTRAVALTTQDGVLVNSANTSQRYLGTLRTTAANQFDDNLTTRNLWNYYNRVPRAMQVFEATNTWNYNINTWRQALADVANDVSAVIGVNESLFRVTVKTNNTSTAAGQRNFSVGIGLDSLTVNSAILLGTAGNGSGELPVQTWAHYIGYPGIGSHTFSWIEIGISANNVRSWGDNGNTTTTNSGILAVFDG